VKLFYAPLSTYCMKALVALYEKELEFTPEFVNPMNADSWAAFKKIWPIGKIPLLMLDDGRRIPEATIIAEHADRMSDQGPRLIPEKEAAALEVRLQDRLFDLYLNDQVVQLLFEGRKPEEARNKETIRRASDRLAAMYGLMEEQLSKRTWATGEDFTLADCAAAPGLYYGRMVAPFDDKPAIRGYWERLADRPSFRKVEAEAAPMVERFLAGPGG
jgi:glutathione S-transferase